MENRNNMKSKKRNQKGSILTMAAVGLVPILGLAAFSIDLGRAYLVRTQLKNAADLAVLAGISRFAENTQNPDVIKIESAIEAVAAQFTAHSQNTPVFINQIQPGNFTYAASKFNATADYVGRNVNAIRVTIRLGAGGNQPLVFTIARALGVDQTVMEVESTAAFGPRYVVLATDVSSSMERQNYKKDCATAVAPFDDPANRPFKNVVTLPGFHKNDHQNCVALGGFKPQPISDVFDTTADNLYASPLFAQNNYYSAIIAFGSSPDVILPMGQNNKSQAQQLLRNTVQDWHTYAASGGNNPAWHSLKTAPGGLNPPFSGYTNLGGAMQEAEELILTAINSGLQASRILVLLTDGDPNCADKGGNTCNVNDAARSAGEAYALAQARSLLANKIKLIPIFYGQQMPIQDDYTKPAMDYLHQHQNDPNFDFWNWQQTKFNPAYSQYLSDLSSWNSSNPGFAVLQRIVGAIGISVYSASNPAELADIMDQLSQRSAFVLVRTV